MLYALSALVLGSAIAHGLATTVPDNADLPVHIIARINDGPRFEDLAVRANGQILATTTQPNASIYQFDPLGILPPTLVYNVPNIRSAVGIAEREQDIFYVASGDFDIMNPSNTTPASYSITRIDMRGVEVLPKGGLTKAPYAQRVASLPNAALPNGIAFARPLSEHLLVADSFRGLIWNVNVCTGEVGVTLKDNSTTGSTPTGPNFTGVNGVKVRKGNIYYTNTGKSSLYRVAVDEKGQVQETSTPTLITGNLTCDDLVLDRDGTAYVAGPLGVVTKVDPSGQQELSPSQPDLAFRACQSRAVQSMLVKF
ncbi:hypothetical protein CB0940_06026 [Cercospora beticola]|uniref:SMP-30/Gluconolactonase/LRE-like region domain-containing protein n=1 Tax=Cercospora beticola TaxID=122368 RepID=A0A2G5HYN1_CERBT|nr:hypothetical protein CB0940_06026 [Cercospora beticola]PIA97638.1 hypothetical protein CB0940_06026 [Cercospora beticola]WPA98637.1 hypothetical protein RHO25_003250 [Cercospora beticola]